MSFETHKMFIKEAEKLPNWRILLVSFQNTYLILENTQGLPLLFGKESKQW